MSNKVKNPKKLKEAHQHLQNAEKYMKTSMFQWKPDYLSAAPELEKAGHAFLAAGELEQAAKVFYQGATIQVKNGSYFRAGQYMEIIGKEYIKENNAKQAVYYYEKASSFYLEMGEFSKGAEIIKKGAQMIEAINVKEALGLYLKACDLYETHDKPQLSIDAFRKTLSCAMKNKDYTTALKILTRQLALYEEMGQVDNIHKVYLSEAVIHLSMKDLVAAEQAYMNHLQKDSYLHAEECSLEDSLIRGFKNHDDNLVKQTILKVGFNYLDQYVGRLAKKLTCYDNEYDNDLMERPNLSVIKKNSDRVLKEDILQNSASSWIESKQPPVQDNRNVPSTTIQEPRIEKRQSDESDDLNAADFLDEEVHEEKANELDLT